MKFVISDLCIMEVLNSSTTPLHIPGSPGRPQDKYAETFGLGRQVYTNADLVFRQVNTILDNVTALKYPTATKNGKVYL
ncbi:MAG: hypothetical protein HF976_11390 [ANME-2 cluster archaeon]|nr:hypothetical protein [ANME-2 cluster archaeon]MBC2701988.1 hypothetical protein [ANME-2 cluster archaeon]MBC2708949.1 hypothetical protein [ANME-2 cluster archaeon]MBC2745785.1 hypothetical protein [ANME-2 cluster archaeon]